tara:strand:+ start:9026 stop:9964 length:939 start_codon:yes stop_codon:yes gene_type:complete
MSHLLSFDKKTLDLKLLIWAPAASTCFEDHYRSQYFKPIDFLKLSEKRKEISKDPNAIFIYVNSLYALMDKWPKLDVSRLANSPPISFTWKMNGSMYSSTSLKFELYCATQVAAHQSFINGLHALDESAKKGYLKDSVLYLKELHNILGGWKTKDYVIPACPVECNTEYVNKSLCVVNGFKALSLLHDENNEKIRGNVLNTAMNLFSNSWLRQKVFGELSIQHYFLTRSLLYRELGINEESENKALSAINESLYCSDQVTPSLCYVLQKTKNILEDRATMLERKDTLETVNYAVACNLSEISLPKAALKQVK